MIATLVLACNLAAISWIDFRKHIIPNSLNLSLAICGLLAAITIEGHAVEWVLFDCLLTFLVMAAIGNVYRSLRGRTGIGWGDIKFLTAAAPWVGMFGIPWIVLVASISGLTFALGASWWMGNFNMTKRLAFGPHLSLGLMVTWIFGNLISVPV